MSSQFNKNLQRHLTGGALRFLEWAIKFVPRCLIDWIIGGLSFIVCLNTTKLNQICARNLQLVYGDSKEIDGYNKFSKQLIKSIGYSMIDLLYYVNQPDKLLKIVSLENESNLKEALKEGRGVIAVSAHLSNFPLMFVSLVQRGYKVNVIIRPMRNQDFSVFMYKLCSKWGINMIQTAPAKQFLKESLGALKRNELLFILLDENVDKEKGIETKFLNRKVTRGIGPMLFLKRTNAPILPIFIAKDDKKHYKIFIEEAFRIYEGSDNEENIIKNITGLSNIIEKYVKQFPNQWGGWFNKRWAEANDLCLRIMQPR